MGKLAVFSGVSEFPIRVKCASLSWHAMKAGAGRDRSDNNVTGKAENGERLTIHLTDTTQTDKES